MPGQVSDIDLRYLRVFVAVVESGGFSVAAAKLNLSESTISSHMTDLEARLGMRLCDRGRAGFRLTSAGEEVFEAFIRLSDQLDRFRESVVSLKSDLAGTVRIGVADAVLTNLSLPVVECLQLFTETAPELILDVCQDDPRGLERRLIDEDLHIAVGPCHREIAGLVHVSLGLERNFLYCAEGHPLFAMEDADITIDVLEASGLISRGYLDRFDEAFFSTEGHSAIVHQIEAAAILIQTGRFIGFLPDHYVGDGLSRAEVRAIHPTKIFLDVPFALSFKRSKKDDAVVKRFVDIATKQVMKG